MSGIRAVLFDCNGVIANDEPIHFKLFRKVLKEEGIPLTRALYMKRYLAMDDRSCFTDALQRHRRPVSKKYVQGLIDRKAAYYLEEVKRGVKIFPGVRGFVERHKKQYALAVVSGALRHEIELILKAAGILKAFSFIVSAEDVKHGKPHPECYLKGLRGLNRLERFRKHPLKASECAAIEDSIHGVEAAQKAGMKCLAVTNSYPSKELRHADSIVRTLQGALINEDFSSGPIG